MKEQDSNVIGVGFGSDSVRAIVVKVRTGEVLATGISFYPRWKLGKYQHPERAVFWQYPQDYLDAFTECVRGTLDQITEEERGCVCGIALTSPVLLRLPWITRPAGKRRRSPEPFRKAAE